MSEQRNLIIALILSALVLFGWSLVSDRVLPTATKPTTQVVKGKSVPLPDPNASPTGSAPAVVRARAVVLAESPRVAIATPRLAGTLNLKGARIDDLVMSDYKETLAKNSLPVRLFSPSGAGEAYFAQFGWTGQNVRVPDANTLWTASAPKLTPETPVTLSWDNGQGQRFELMFAVDRDFLFTVTQRVVNAGAGAVAVTPFSLVNRTGISKDPSGWTIHTGPIGTFDGVTNYKVDFKDLTAGEAPRFTSTGGWIGFTDKYWLAALSPPAAAKWDGGFRGSAGDRFQADAAYPTQVVQPRTATTTQVRLFAGAKEVKLLRRYQNEAGVTRFDGAIDWGWFEILEKPIFFLLDWLFRMVGNFGVAIMLLTIVVRGVMFPIAQKQFRSMAGMRIIQPKMKALQERYKDDKPKLQQEMLKLYQEAKVNPIAGCLPTLLQIPIFYALYKVLLVTIEMRHQPFVGWIHDLSAPDPATILNGFGYLNFAVPHFFAIGVLPVFLGISMWLQFKLNPTPMDDTQKQIFAIMPWMMMFIMGTYAAGLVLYWTMSNVLTILQQKWLYSRMPQLSTAEATTP
ncbi:membrane protein insertase YidC [Sphingomonas quercus]|uniref:Membrane protein insertase YidC n=1 Tax=Sphingomonas quercus TaxID=2842451 RepID=A0ABS6BMN2_9SPHN|nr:membrane protein insertase YidC [Sphingomonas quercus]